MYHFIIIDHLQRSYNFTSYLQLDSEKNPEYLSFPSIIFIITADVPKSVAMSISTVFFNTFF